MNPILTILATLGLFGSAVFLTLKHPRARRFVAEHPRLWRWLDRIGLAILIWQSIVMAITGKEFMGGMVALVALAFQVKG